MSRFHWRRRRGLIRSLLTHYAPMRGSHINAPGKSFQCIQHIEAILMSNIFLVRGIFLFSLLCIENLRARPGFPSVFLANSRLRSSRHIVDWDSFNIACSAGVLRENSFAPFWFGKRREYIQGAPAVCFPNTRALQTTCNLMAAAGLAYLGPSGTPCNFCVLKPPF